MTYSKDRHPKFDEFWGEHNRLVFFMANKLHHKFNCDRDELVGSLTLWFNMVLYTYDETKGKFSTYFCNKCYGYLLRVWIRRESQAWDLFVSKLHKTKDDQELSERNYAQHETNFHLYRIPEYDQSDVQQVIDFFDTVEECWRYMVSTLNSTDREMMELYYKSNWTGEQIGEKFKVTKQRVFQRIDRAKGLIREKIKNLSAFAHLFEDDASAGDA